MDLSVAYTQSSICINYDSLVKENYRNLYSPGLQCQAGLRPLDSHPQQGPSRARRSNGALRVVWSTCELALLCRNNQMDLILVSTTRLPTKRRACRLPAEQTQDSVAVHRILSTLPCHDASELSLTDLGLRFSEVIDLR